MVFAGKIVRTLGYALLLGAVSSPGATRVWTGRQDGRWSNPANWQDGQIPVHLDAIEFPGDGLIRQTVNDLAGREFTGLTFTGGSYSVEGNPLYLLGDILHVPGNTTNRVACDIFVGAPLRFVCASYFNQLEFAGAIEVAYPLRLETSSSIKFFNRIWRSPSATTEVTQASTGRISFGPVAYTEVPWRVVRGTLDLSGLSFRPHVENTLHVGVDQPGAPAAVVQWGASDKVAPFVTVQLHRSGLLELNGFNQTLALLTGDGAVSFAGGRLELEPDSFPNKPAAFRGELRGPGAVRVAGMSGGWELGAYGDFSGTISVTAARPTGLPAVPSQVMFSGALSTATLEVTEHSRLDGSGLIGGLVVSNATLQPGPGALRILTDCRLSMNSRLEITLDGPQAGWLEAGALELGQATLDVTYGGGGPASVFTLIRTGSAAPDSRFQGLPEGAWLVAGDPAAPSEFRLTYAGHDGHDVVLTRTGWFVPPPLFIRPLPRGGRQLAWPRERPGYTLQHSPGLDPAAWTSHGLAAPEASTTEFFVIDDTTDPHRFYRLVR